MALPLAVAKPRRVTTTKSPCTTINHCAGRAVRRDRKLVAREPAPMPTRITVRSSENTARKPPSSIEKWRNHRISMPIAEKPHIASVRPVSGRARGLSSER
jgi:hypothetical protein